jgi:hypothetical protein
MTSPHSNICNCSTRQPNTSANLCTETELLKSVRGCVKNYVKGCVNLKKHKSHGKAVEVSVNIKEENS